DPHGSRGSTEHHALDYKKEVKRFSSSDILAAYKASARGEKVAALPTLSSRSDEENKRASEAGPAAEEKGNGGEASASSSAPTSAPAAAPSAAPAATGSESLDKSIKIRSWTDEPADNSSKQYSFDRLKDALDPANYTPSKLAPPPAPAPPVNLIDTNDSPYAPSPLEEDWPSHRRRLPLAPADSIPALCIIEQQRAASAARPHSSSSRSSALLAFEQRSAADRRTARSA
ncbi:MAG: hypothetical protein SGPRY_011349, partial [Prymnesium sp.]